MKQFPKTIFIMFAFLLVLSCAQRGGSRSKSSQSQNSGSSYRRRHGGSYFGAGGNCTTVNGTTTCAYQDGEFSWTTFLVGLVILAAIIGWAVNAAAADAEKRKTVIDSAMKQFQAKMQEWSASLTPEEKDKLVNQFMSKSYTMVIDIKDKDQKFFCQIKVTDLKKENDSKYRIKMNGSDQVGKSKFEGLLMFTSNGLSFKLSKVYDDRKKAQQTGEFQNLFYEGAGTPDKIAGNWAFHGHETSLLHSGTWAMMQL